jgi:MFS family permease
MTALDRGTQSNIFRVPSIRIDHGLDALNFFLADVQGGLGPYLAVYLLTVRHWNEAAIGVVMSIAGIAGILAQTPAGALVDAVRAKRAIVVAAALIVTVGSIALYFEWSAWSVAFSQAAVGASGAVFGPAIAAISLGLVGHAAFAARNGRNQAFNHAGNAVAAVLAGASAYLVGPVAVFFLLAAMAAASLVSALAIPGAAIDHDVARGLREDTERDGEQPAGFRMLLTDRRLLIFGACVALFHLGNAAMLPLVGQKLALRDQNQGTALMSVCILAAQLVMVPMAVLVGRKADSWGRKPLFLAGFLILPIRGVLYTASDDPFWLLGVQMLDGIGAGLTDALLPLIVADLTWGTGRFNVTQGAVRTAHGIGASLSTTIAGLIVVSAGYSAAFLALAAIAAVGAALFWLGMPETRDIGDREVISQGGAAAPVAAGPPG